MKGRQAVIFCIAIFITRCSSSESPKISDQSYFPLRIGNFQVYQVNVDTIKQTVCGKGGDAQYTYQLKTLVTDSSKNSSGGYRYTIHRYTRPDTTQAWADLDTWVAQVNGNQVIVNESNVLYVKFIFPLTNDGVWNINLYNDLDAVSDTLKNVGQPYTLASGKKFPTTFISQTNTISLISRDTRREVYAVSVGLIYEELIQLNYFTDPTCFGLNEVKNGVIYYQSLLSYGHQ